MPDVNLEQLMPEPIVLRARAGGPILATLPGEIDMPRMLELTQLAETGGEHERVLLDMPDTDDNREAREQASAGLREFYEKASAILEGVAELEPGVERLELTGTQIVALVSMLVAPAQRTQLLATAYLMAVGVEFGEDGLPVPLDGTSLSISSESDAPGGGPAPIGASSDGASGSRSAPRRKRTRASSSKPSS